MILQILKIFLSIIFGAGVTFFTTILIDELTINKSSGTGGIVVGLIFLVFLIVEFFFAVGLGYYLLSFLF